MCAIYKTQGTVRDLKKKKRVIWIVSPHKKAVSRPVDTFEMSIVKTSYRYPVEPTNLLSLN